MFFVHGELNVICTDLHLQVVTLGSRLEDDGSSVICRPKSGALYAWSRLSVFRTRRAVSGAAINTLQKHGFRTAIA
jgi:hypothetical protein